jgi:hypothetical protein
VVNASDEKPRQHDEPEGLPETDAPRARKLRHKPVPQVHNDQSEQQREERRRRQSEDGVYDDMQYARRQAPGI